MFKFMTSPGFAEQKRGLKAKVSIRLSSSEHHLIDARTSQWPILNVSGGGGGSLQSNTLYTLLMWN